MSDGESTTRKPTAAADWKRETEIELPTGNLVRVRYPTLYVWLKTGQLSKETERIVRLVAEEKREETTFIERQEAMAELICKTVIDPPLTLAPQDGALCIADLSDTDKAFLAMTLDLAL